MDANKFRNFLTSWENCTRLRALSVKKCEIFDIQAFGFLIVRVLLIWQMIHLQFMMLQRQFDILTLSTTFYELSVFRNLFSHIEMRQSGAIGN